MGCLRLSWCWTERQKCERFDRYANEAVFRDGKVGEKKKAVFDRGSEPRSRLELQRKFCEFPEN